MEENQLELLAEVNILQMFEQPDKGVGIDDFLVTNNSLKADRGELIDYMKQRDYIETIRRDEVYYLTEHGYDCAELLLNKITYAVDDMDDLDKPDYYVAKRTNVDRTWSWHPITILLWVFPIIVVFAIILAIIGAIVSSR